MAEDSKTKTYVLENIGGCDCDEPCADIDKEKCKKKYIKMITKVITEWIEMGFRYSQELETFNMKVLIENYNIDFILKFQRTYRYEGMIKSIKKAKKVREEGICNGFRYLGMTHNTNVDAELMYVMITKIRQRLGHKIPNDLIEYADDFLKL